MYATALSGLRKKWNAVHLHAIYRRYPAGNSWSNMLIRNMTPQECSQMLSRIGFGRLGCARDNQPYVAPIYFAYEDGRLYGFTTVGRKIEWMRTNPKVCVEVDEVLSHFQWMSVIVIGRYQELPHTPELNSERLHAITVLEKRVLWWQTALAAKRLLAADQTAEPLFYCIHIDSITGQRAVPDASESTVKVSAILEP